MHYNKFKLLNAAMVGALWLSQSGPSAAEPAVAAGDTDTGGGLTEIIVTARRREENVQTVPESIIALSADDIKERQITSLVDLQGSVPSFSVQSGSADLFSCLCSLRGLAMLNIGQNTDPTTATYVDGVYQGLSASNLRQEDLQSIQVLLGPQGTLFGRNSTGGAILINHNLPTDQFEGWVRGGYGNYDTRDAEAMINIPIAGDAAGLRVVGGYQAHNGYGTASLSGGAFNPMTVPDFMERGGTFAGAGCTLATPCNVPVNDLSSYNVLATLQLKPADHLNIILRGGYVHATSNGAGGGLTYLAPVGLGAFEAGTELGIPGYMGSAVAFLTPVAAGGCGGGASMTPACLAAYGTLFSPTNIGTIQAAAAARTTLNPRDDVLDIPQINNASKVTGSGIISYDVSDNLQLKSITGYVDGKRFLQQDLSSSSFAIINSLQNTEEKLFTEEVQVIGNTLGNRLKYTAGFYYYHKDAIDNQDGYTAPGLVIIPQSLFDVNVHVNSPSGYAQLTFAVTPQINITGGVRYTSENKDLDQANYASFVLPFLNPGGVPVGTYLTTIPFSSHSANTAYLAEIDYKPVEQMMLYFKTSDAFRSGGPQETAPAGFPGFAPEKVTDYEVGVKSDWLNDHLRLNADVYREDYNDVQQTLFFTEPSGALVNAVANVGNAYINGFEFQLQVIPVKNLTLGAALSLMDPRYTAVSALATANGITLGSPFANVQRTNYNLSGDYRIPAGAGDVTLHIDWHWRSETPYLPGYTNGPTGQGYTVQDPYGILNARIAYKPSKGDWELALWGQNLTNKTYLTDIFNSTGTPTAPGGLGFIEQASAAPPLTFGGEVTWKFH